MDKTTLEDLIQDPVLRAKVVGVLREVDEKIETSVIGSKFVMQMLGDQDGAVMPDIDVLTVVLARHYAESMVAWDASDMFLPVLFARLTMREVHR